MLENSNHEKPKEAHLREKDWNDIRKLTLERIINKLGAARVLLKDRRYDNVSAGLYTYALEEFGKLILLNNAERIANNTKRKIIYKNEFTYHEKKFETAFDYLQSYSSTSYKCYVLNNEGSFTPQSYTWRSFNIGLLADFKARTSIFYTDLSYTPNNGDGIRDKIIIDELPKIERKLLYQAIDELK
jgi:AbiV family abortive infection protein